VSSFVFLRHITVYLLCDNVNVFFDLLFGILLWKRKHVSIPESHQEIFLGKQPVENYHCFPVVVLTDILSRRSARQV